MKLFCSGSWKKLKTQSMWQFAVIRSKRMICTAVDASIRGLSQWDKYAAYSLSSGYINVANICSDNAGFVGIGKIRPVVLVDEDPSMIICEEGRYEPKRMYPYL